MFLKSDLVSIYELMLEIYGMQQDSKSVTDIYSDLKILWEELEIYICIPICRCKVKCTS